MVFLVHDDKCPLWHGGKCRCNADGLVRHEGQPPRFVTLGAPGYYSTKPHTRVPDPYAVTDDMPPTDEDGRLVRKAA